jgi:hypothetical protein
MPFLTGIDLPLATTLLALCASVLMVQIGLGKRRLRWRASPVPKRRPIRRPRTERRERP